MSFKLEELEFQQALLEDPILLSAAHKELISLIDLTSLNENDTTESIAAFSQKAVTSQGKVAALCVYPRFVQEVAANLKGSKIKVATVANFPHGLSSLTAVLEEIELSLRHGADEIDVVFPYPAYLLGERAYASSFVSRCKELCSEARLKVILETSALQDLSLIARAAEDAIFAGADFVKTSTGKLPQGASLEAAAVILSVIKKLSSEVNRELGFKAAGGIREPEQALQYLMLAKNRMGPNWVKPSTFRLGASQLLDKLLLPPTIS